MDKKSGGFTLIELIIVIAILVVLTAIATPKWIQYKALAEERVCITNRITVQRLFDTYLFENGYDHIENEGEVDFIFNRFLILKNIDKICPSGGLISYEGGKVKCSLHQEENEEDNDEPPGDGVPWL